MRPAFPAIRPAARFAFFALLGALAFQACSLPQRDKILILVRAGDPVSRSIADYYASVRGVPDRRILTLEIAPRDDDENFDGISATDFETQIAVPIESYLVREDPDAEISILVTTLGIPIRIGRCNPDQPHYPRDCHAPSVDAALAGLGRLDRTIPDAGSVTPDRAIDGRLKKTAGDYGPWTPNPYFGDPRSFEEFRRQQGDASLRFLVARLTGPRSGDDPESKLPSAIRAMIDGATSQSTREQPAPLWRVFANAPAETRDAASAALLGPLDDLLARYGHRSCDDCQPTAESPRPIGAVVQMRPAAKELDHLAFPGLIISLGHRGRDLAEFHRSIDLWTSHGARAISMHLDDPSLGGVTRPAQLLTAWLDGRTALEAHFSSVPHLGWTNVFVGDPLLRLESPTQRKDGDLDRDWDGDGVSDEEDNCLQIANSDQRDSNSDGVGNRCDPDVNNDGRVDTSWGRIYPIDSRGDLERIALTAQNGPYDPDHDLDGDGRVSERDLALAQLWLFRRPGPSGRPSRRQ